MATPINLIQVKNVNTAIALPFSFTSSGGVLSTSNIGKIWSDRVLSAIGTRHFERVMNLNYGSKVVDSLFDLSSVVVGDLKKEIEVVFARELGQLHLLSVVVTENAAVTGDIIIGVAIDYELPSKQKDSILVKLGTFTTSGELVRETT